MFYVRMVAKFLDPNKPWSRKHCRKKRNKSFLCMIVLYTQEQVFPSFEKANGHLCHERLLRSRSNMTSHFSSILMYDLFFDSLTCYCAGIRVPFIHFLSIDNILNLLFLTYLQT